jgi:hypothetical protein
VEVLSQIQKRLMAINGICFEDLDVRDFVIDKSISSQIPGYQEDLPEQFFVLEEDKAIDLALYLDQKILDGFEKKNPFKTLDNGNLEDTLIATEGVSHFIFFIWRAKKRWPVTPLELEIQAEVDKFCLCWDILYSQGCPPNIAAKFVAWANFKKSIIRESLPAKQKRIYAEASRIAEGFCRKFDKWDSAAKKSIQDYYRLTLSQKKALVSF